MAVTEHELSQHNKMVERVYICKEKKKKMNRRKRGVSVRGSEKSRRQAVHANHAMPGTLVAIGASRVGIENTSSCPINRRSHAVTVKKSEFSCVSRNQWRAAERVRGVGVARGNTILSAPALGPAHDRTASTQQPAARLVSSKAMQ